MRVKEAGILPKSAIKAKCGLSECDRWKHREVVSNQVWLIYITKQRHVFQLPVIVNEFQPVPARHVLGQFFRVTASVV